MTNPMLEIKDLAFRHGGRLGLHVWCARQRFAQCGIQEFHEALRQPELKLFVIAAGDPEQQAILLDGGVRYEDPGTQIRSDSAEFAYLTGRIRFEGAEFSLGSSDARGAVRLFEKGGRVRQGVRPYAAPRRRVEQEIRGGQEEGRQGYIETSKPASRFWVPRCSR